MYCTPGGPTAYPIPGAGGAYRGIAAPGPIVGQPGAGHAGHTPFVNGDPHCEQKLAAVFMERLSLSRAAIPPGYKSGSGSV
jgi:hypothetical protein